MTNEIEHADDEPVIFGYAASCNVTFRGEDESGITWGEWRGMSDKEKDVAYEEFIYNTLGVAVWPK